MSGVFYGDDDNPVKVAATTVVLVALAGVMVVSDAVSSLKDRIKKKLGRK